MNKLFNDVISVGFCSKNLIFLGNVSSNDYTNTKFNRLDSLKGYTCVHRVSSLKWQNYCNKTSKMTNYFKYYKKSNEVIAGYKRECYVVIVAEQ